MRLATALAVLTFSAAPAMAGEAWDDIRPMVWGERAIETGEAALTLTAPYRAADDREVPLGAEIAFTDGRLVRSVTLIIDENPMPVSATVTLDEPRRSFGLLGSMRLNGPSPVRAVVEDDSGRLYMAESFVKTSGLGACAAPPVADPAIAMETLGQIALGVPGLEPSPAAQLAALGAGVAGDAAARVEIRHPSHSGLQMDQITLLYIPAHYVETVEVWQDGARYFSLTGSISLSEDPEIEFTHDGHAGTLRVRVTDTEGGVYQQDFGLGAS